MSPATAPPLTAEDRIIAIARARAMARSGAARAARLRAGLSLGEMAEGVGVATSTIHRWENGSREPRGEPAIRWLRIVDRLIRGVTA